MNVYQSRILQILADGAPHRRPALAAFVGLTDRTLRKHIAQLRKAGHTIVAAPKGGYVLTDDRKAVADFSAALRNRGADMIETAAALSE